MNNRTVYYLLSLSLLSLIIACQSDSRPFEGGKSASDVQLFKQLPATQTKITFNNEVLEDENYNHILQDVIFNGGGVAVIDVNNDGLQDLFFAGNQKSDKLYLNKGNMEFEDITVQAGINSKTWSTAVAVADVNNDGWMDIYVGKYFLEPAEARTNLLYLNNGDNTFTEKSAQYGINDMGHCTAVNFFDYDKDGWLDLYVGNQPFVARHIKNTNAESFLTAEQKAQLTDRLYHNNGDGTFTDVTGPAGITNYNYTLSATVADMNNDGWQDIYVACDYEEPDVFYQNNGDGTFTNVADDVLRHMSNFSMGVDLADINNDGWMDIYVADMVAADNYRLKANMSGMNPEKFWRLAANGYHYQYMFNMLQLNNGNGSFSEIGHLAGLSNTDWSWATLFGDYDNDGDKDLLVTNGLVRDIKNKDYINKRSELMDSLVAEARAQGIERPQINSMKLIKDAPSVKLANYIYENNGDLTFNDRVVEWGLEEKTWSHGAIYSDLDQDGDLDLVISNMNDISSVYENQSSDLELNNYLQVRLEGNQGNNRLAYGSRVWVYHGEEMQVLDVSPTRGYFSSTDPTLHFGLGANQKVDKLVVKWPDGKITEMADVPVNQKLMLKQSEAGNGDAPDATKTKALFTDITAASGMEFTHRENDFDDYEREILLPHRMSTLGPCLEKGDVNGDGLTDIFVGGAAGQAGILYLQQPGGKFQPSGSAPWAADRNAEDIDALFFDADNDEDLDLYVASGGNEFDPGMPQLQDRLYLNDGQGNFRKDPQAIPDLPISSGTAAAGDLDGDGDLDLFVGGRQTPGKYGIPAKSYLLQNNNGRFINVTETLAPELVQPGMVTDAVWFDFDDDNDQDLVVVGEWMPISFYANEKGTLTNITDAKNMSNTSGWWNRIVLEDMDGDGDQDMIAGNLGLNIKYKASEEQPFRVFVKDFDGNGTHDVYLAYYDTDGVCYPVRGRQCSSQQMPFIKKEFKNYHEFASAPVDKVLGDRREGATELETKLFESVYIENIGDGEFELRLLPNEAQIAPIFGISCYDFNNDGNKDILVAGNYYEREVETSRSDAGIGQVLLGDGKGNFQPMHPAESGLKAYKDVRDVEMILNENDKPVVLIANNSDAVQVYQMND